MNKLKSIILLFSVIYTQISANFLDIPVLWNKKEWKDNQSSSDNSSSAYIYSPGSPVVLCNYLPKDFYWCEPPLDLKGNRTRFNELKYGCYRWGGQKFGSVQKTSLVCHALEGIECAGNRTFFVADYPCVKYSNHYFLSSLLYSLLLGFLGIDRFCLGHTGTAVGKLLTIGGVGVWWLVDIVLLIKGDLMPADDTTWLPFY